MCGIAGQFGTRRVDDACIRRCLALLRHRGPDASGVYQRGGEGGRALTLLHTRLSIIDLDQRANQPMRRGPHVLICNGELYNYRELRAELLDEGVVLRTSSDTEVLLTLLARDGLEALDRCEGMWALAWYDERTGELVLARDRFGEKPLYVYETPDGISFASEIKAVTALAGRPLEINFDHVRRYLVNGYKSLYKTREEFFHGVRQVEPGSALRVSAGGRTETVRYWTWSCAPDETMSFEEAVEGAREHLVDAVTLRLRADVRPVFLLSGGVDSNAIAGIARRIAGAEVRAYTIVNVDARYDERAQVEAAVRALEIEHVPVTLERDRFLPRLRALVRQHDAPIATISYFVQALLHDRIAGDGYRVALSGTGADELFSGYYDHHLAYLASLNGHAEERRAARDLWTQHVRPHVRNPHLRNADLFLDDPTFRKHIFLDQEDFAGCLTEPWLEPFAEHHYARDLLRNRMLNELFHESVPVILHEDDHNAMARSIENRSPFLDRGLFEFTQRIPTRHLIRDGYAKAVLREAVRGIAPDAIINERRKTGFNAPIEDLLDFHDPETRRELLDDRSPIFEIVRRDRIDALLRQEDLPNSRSKFAFNFINAMMFLEEFS